MAKRTGLLGLVVAASVALGGCAVPEPRTPALAGVIAEGRAEGLRLVDPLALDERTLAEIDESVRHLGTSVDRLATLRTYLTAPGHLDFSYVEGLTFTAREAYRERRGDCLAYTALIVAIARHMGVPAYFVHATEVRNYYEKQGWFMVSSHVAVGQGEGRREQIMDLTAQDPAWKLALYEPIDDEAALALYYNNLAVDAMTGGHPDEAEHLLRFFLARSPSVVELYNNLGVLLNRTRRHAEALAVLQDGIARFPEYEPLYTNALRAARALGEPDAAAFYERRGQEISHGDPYFIFARALSFYDRAKFTLAAEQLERAAAAKPDSPVILAWLSRAYLSAGRWREGIEAFGKAERLAPGEQILVEMREKYPELR
jgi:hypothetical protein